MTATSIGYRLPEDVIVELKAPFDSKHISRHPTKTYLSVLKAYAVTTRLNDVFGPGRWDLIHEIVPEITTDHYVAVRGSIVLLDYKDADGNYLHTPEQYGGHALRVYKYRDENGNKLDPPILSPSHEPADGLKSAVTDLQSKCASYLYIGHEIFMGEKAAPPREQQLTEPKDGDEYKCFSIKKMKEESKNGKDWQLYSFDIGEGMRSPTLFGSMIPPEIDPLPEKVGEIIPTGNTHVTVAADGKYWNVSAFRIGDQVYQAGNGRKNGGSTRNDTGTAGATEEEMGVKADWLSKLQESGLTTEEKQGWMRRIDQHPPKVWLSGLKQALGVDS